MQSHTYYGLGILSLQSMVLFNLLTLYPPCKLLCALVSVSGLGLSQDVAGATFMAAGSSAPELVTAFLGNDALVQQLVSALQLAMSVMTRPFSA